MQSRDEIRKIVERAYEDHKPGSRIVSAGQLSRFRFDFKENDYVITYDPESRIYHVGRLTGPYRYDPSRKEFFHVRKVEWEGTVPRDKLSTSTRNTLGATTTIFELGREAEAEILAVLKTGNPPEVVTKEDQEEELEEIVKDQAARATGLIQDRISNLDWEEAQRLVAGILQAMGYKTRISPVGPVEGRMWSPLLTG